MRLNKKEKKKKRDENPLSFSLGENVTVYIVVNNNLISLHKTLRGPEDIE